MILDLLSYTGSALAAGPVAYITYRAFQFRNAIVAGKEIHKFKPHIRRDMHGPHTMGWCDVCKQGRRAWVHGSRSVSDSEELSTGAKILELERAEIKWRFANDQDWVKIFGEEYDPKTFDEIPKYHNGECGGPHDSCERCAWEADREEDAKKQKRKEQWAEINQVEKETKVSAEQEIARETKEYADVLWTIWNTVHGPDEALSEYRDIADELGMLKNHQVRDRVKKLGIWQRLEFCLASPDKHWNRREEHWHNEKKRRKDRDRYRDYDYY